MIRPVRNLFLLLVILVAVVGCVPVATPGATPVAPAAASRVIRLVDQAGHEVDIPQPVERVVSTYGMATLYVYALGAGDRLAAATFLGGTDPARSSGKLQQQPPQGEGDQFE
jgi:ABC-type Fe3+-hydroxamate transport system substrate-binding protein